MAEPLVAPAADVLQLLLAEGFGGFTPFARALDGLTGEEALRTPAGSPHCVADVLGHMVFWQERFLSVVDGGEPVPVRHAADGWPEVTAEEWPSWLQRYFAGLERYRSLATDERQLARPLVPGRDRSVGSALMDYYVHEVHHLGQIILLRRMIGAWPPPGSGDSW